MGSKRSTWSKSSKCRHSFALANTCGCPGRRSSSWDEASRTTSRWPRRCHPRLPHASSRLRCSRCETVMRYAQHAQAGRGRVFSDKYPHAVHGHRCMPKPKRTRDQRQAWFGGVYGARAVSLPKTEKEHRECDVHWIEKLLKRQNVEGRRGWFHHRIEHQLDGEREGVHTNSHLLLGLCG